MRFSKTLLPLIALIPLALGCPEGETLPWEGWVPGPDGPEWGVHEVEDGRITLNGDQTYKIEYLVEYHQSIENPDPYRANIVLKTWSATDWVVPYVIDDGVPASYRQTIQLAIDEWNEKTDVRWVPRAEAEYQVDYVRFRRDADDSGQCRADAGRQRGEQFVSLTYDPDDGRITCSRGTLIHEMGHTLGLLHEHQRRDRDSYVSYQPQNLSDPDLSSAFDPTGIAWGDYDYFSIMHYSATGTAMPDTETLTPRQRPGSDEEPIPSAVLGHRLALSKGDIAITNALVNNTYRINSNDAAYNARSILAAEGVAPESREHMSGDFNGDGRMDLLALRGDDNRLWVSLAREDGTYAAATSWHPSLCGAETCAVGDPNGDGFDDIVFANAQGQLRIAASDGEGAFRTTYGSVWHPTFGIPGADLLIGDYDGDCHDDAVVVVALNYLGVEYINVYMWNGSQMRTYATFESGEFSLGDVDADGLADLVTVDSQGRVYVALSDDGVFGAAELWSLGTCSNQYECHLADMDGDDRADVVATDPDAEHHLDRVRIALSNGYEFVDDVPNFHQLDCRRDYPCLMGDVNDDGLGDAVDPVGRLETTSSKFDRERGDVFVSLGVGRWPGSASSSFWTEDIGPRKRIWGGTLNGGCVDLGIDPGLGGGLDPGLGGQTIGSGSFGGFDLGF